MSRPMSLVDAASITCAAQRIAPHIRHTPLWRLSSATLGLPGARYEIWLKLEQLQLSGSFKARGMFNRLLSHPIPASGVIVASGGNAGIATATAARSLGVVAEVFVPTTSPRAKRDRLAALGARVQAVGTTYTEALAACAARQRETGALMTHAYDQVEVVAGAGTLAREIELEAGTPELLLVSVGGGGLVAGLAAWLAGRSRVIGLEPELAPTLYRAREAGEPVDVAVGGIAADSLGAQRIGRIAWEVTQRHLAAALLLDEEAIHDAQRYLWKELKLAVEPAAALPLAALRSGGVTPAAGQRVCLILCGANVDPASLA